MPLCSKRRDVVTRAGRAINKTKDWIRAAAFLEPLGDIGELFPNTDEANCNRDSADMLRLAYGRVQAAGYQIVNLDCIVFAERPKLSPHKESIRHRIAEILSLTPDQVYAVTAYLLHLNGIIGEQDVMDAKTLLLVKMPNRDGFVPDPRPDVGQASPQPKR